MKVYDIIIIGAGASGLMAAKELSAAGKQVCILEAKDHIGGRIFTLNDEHFAYPVESGAEFIHGKLEHTFKLIKESGLDYYKIKGNVYQVFNNEWKKENDFIQRADELEKALKEVREDMPLKDFLNQYFPGAKNNEFRKSVTQYAEGYDAADTTRFSTLAFKHELHNEDEDNYRLTNGYTALMQYLWNQCEQKGTVLRLNTIVKEIHWQQNSVQVLANKSSYKAKQVIVTIPLGVWQSRKGSKGSIAFVPALKEKQHAARQLGYGGVIKIAIQFNEVFWKENANRIGFILSDETIPTWWTQQPDKHAMLSGWVAGPAADKLYKLSNDAILKKAIASLAKIFNMKHQQLKERIVGEYVFNWLSDPFARGAYAHQVVGGSKFRQILAAPADDKLFFAGEATYQGSEMGTVEAALASGELVGKQVLARRV